MPIARSPAEPPPPAVRLHRCLAVSWQHPTSSQLPLWVRLVPNVILRITIDPPPSPQSRSRQLSVFTVAAATVSTNDFKNGLTVEVDSVPYKVIGARQYSRVCC